ncbi:hypothetical protein F5Y11DRAFT_364479 [Daldinia sp. FL1419]|nr:hypothetical protein F5Y11DRAFT_364479 [Daldinia sp. FL1419]
MSDSLEIDDGPRQSPCWSEIEDKILKHAVARYGVSRWDDVAKTIWTRKSAEECRARWAELVPVLYEGLARRESIQEQGRARSTTLPTASTSVSASEQDDQSSRLRLPPTEGQEGGDSVTVNTEPSSPTPLTPTTESPPSLTSASARTRRNTEPGTRPLRAKSMPRGRGEEREWLAPHPLMPGRPRKTSTPSRDTSMYRNRDNMVPKDVKGE